MLSGMLERGLNADILFAVDQRVMEHANKTRIVGSASKVNQLASRLVLIRSRFGPDRGPILGDEPPDRLLVI